MTGRGASELTFAVEAVHHALLDIQLVLDKGNALVMDARNRTAAAEMRNTVLYPPGWRS